MNQIGPGIVSIIAGIIGLAMVAVIVGRNAQTSGVISSAGTALSGVIGAAVSPVSGTGIGGYGGLTGVPGMTGTGF